LRLAKANNESLMGATDIAAGAGQTGQAMQGIRLAFAIIAAIVLASGVTVMGYCRISPRTIAQIAIILAQRRT